MESCFDSIPFEYKLYISPHSMQIWYGHGSNRIIDSGQKDTLEECAESLYKGLEESELMKQATNEQNPNAVHWSEADEARACIMADVNGALQRVIKKGKNKRDTQRRYKFYKEFFEELDNGDED